MKSEPAALLERISPDFAFERGRPQPLGATFERGGVNFAIFSSQATAVTLLLFSPGAGEPVSEFPLDPRFNRTGKVWHAFLRALDPGIEYAYRMTGAGEGAAVFARGPALLDPYARSVTRYAGEVAAPSGRTTVECRGSLVEQEFDWGPDQPLNIALADSVIYELHVRGFSRHPSSGAKAPGTFAALAEKIPYLRKLGITAVELMPVNEFDEANNRRSDPRTGRRLRNFWGYDSIGFFALHGPYGSASEASARVREFKELVKNLHAAGIEVILDVVFNHTGEGDAAGPTLSFRGIDERVYYMLDPGTGQNRNYSGCGNTVNCNHPVVRDLVIDCLHYWVTEMHVDGFRFDLASILGRGQDGSVLANAPLLERIAADPILDGIKLIAEAWDAAGLYQVGSFAADTRWAEWNGRYRDDLRRYVRGDAGLVPALATRLSGSADLFQPGGRRPFHSINFITCHDGFTLADLVSYNQKHNEANGERNRDGSSDNCSWNCGTEGPTADPGIEQLRTRQIKNMLVLLLASQGVPMLLAGDERGRSQGGNNNAYCQDNEVGWINWEDTDLARELFRFSRLLIAFRKNHGALRSRSFVPEAGQPFVSLSWHGTRRGGPDWSQDSRALALELTATLNGALLDHLFLISNAFWEPLSFELPQRQGVSWARFVDTAKPAPEDFVEAGILVPAAVEYQAAARSTVLFADLAARRE